MQNNYRSPDHLKVLSVIEHFMICIYELFIEFYLAKLLYIMTTVPTNQSCAILCPIIYLLSSKLDVVRVVRYPYIYQEIPY